MSTVTTSSRSRNRPVPGARSSVGATRRLGGGRQAEGGLGLGRSRRIHGVSVLVVALGFLVVAALATTTVVIYNRNEVRLLGLRTRDASELISGLLPTIQTPLASGVQIAEATHSPSEFRQFMRTEVSPRSEADSASLWILPLYGPPKLEAFVGSRPVMASYPHRAATELREAARTALLSVALVGSGPSERLGFAYSPTNTRYVTYQENPVQTIAKSALTNSTTFRGLDYAIYFGARPIPADMLVTNAPTTPLSGFVASAPVPFGADSFLLVMSPTGSLGGGFFEFLPWAIGILGTLAVLAAGLHVERLVRRREVVESIAFQLDRVAAENRRLYTEQRTIARTLQHALLPQVLPVLPGVAVGARYLPGVAGMDVGGDWYDVVKVSDRSFFVVVGDVSGRGLSAATVMAELRYAIRAYVAEGDPPEVVLSKISRLPEADRGNQFATVLCACIDLDDRMLTVANAGHLNPLLIEEGGCQLVPTQLGVPIGAPSTSGYRAVHVPLVGSGTLLAFTDGLVERRGQPLDESLERLRSIVARPDHGSAGAAPANETLSQLLDRVLAEFGPDGFDDDTALLGVQWPT